MTRSNLFPTAFLLSVLTILIGTGLKFMHLGGSEIFMGITIVLMIIYAFAALSEIYASDRISRNERIMWTVCFVSISLVAGLLYFFIGRPGIKREYKILHRSND